VSLESLIKFRVAGKAPAAVWVVVGKCPASIKDMPDCISVSTKPFALDWRAVKGLHVDVFDLSNDGLLLDQTINAIEQAEPKAVGVACDAGTVGLSEQHEFILNAIRRHLADPERLN
jgi:hypothetical protein